MESFDEWFKATMPNTHKGVGSEKIETFVYETAQDVWNFKQAEVDELREMVRRLVDNTIVAVDDALENQANDLLGGNTDES